MRVAYVLAVIPIARMFTSPFIGYLIDRLPRRALMILDNTSQMILYASIPMLEWRHVLTFPLLLAVVGAAAALSPLSMIGRGVLLPNIVSEHDLEPANGLIQLRSSMVYLMGPALGGMLVAFLGAPGTLLVTAGCYAVYIASLLTIPVRTYDTGSGDPLAAQTHSRLKPWHFLRHNPVLLILGVVTLFFNITYGPLEPALPILVSRVFHAGASTLGLIWSSFAVGALGGTLMWERVRPRWSLRFVVAGIIMSWGLFSALVGLTQHPWQAMALLFCGGFTYAPYNIVATTWQQRLIPNSMRGTVLGTIQSVTSAGLPIGQLLGGMVVSVVGAQTTIAMGGAATVVLGLSVVSLRASWAHLPRENSSC